MKPVRDRPVAARAVTGQSPILDWPAPLRLDVWITGLPCVTDPLPRLHKAPPGVHRRAVYQVGDQDTGIDFEPNSAAHPATFPIITVFALPSSIRALEGPGPAAGASRESEICRALVLPRGAFSLDSSRIGPRLIAPGIMRSQQMQLGCRILVSHGVNRRYVGHTSRISCE